MDLNLGQAWFSKHRVAGDGLFDTAVSLIIKNVFVSFALCPVLPQWPRQGVSEVVQPHDFLHDRSSLFQLFGQ